MAQRIRQNWLVIGVLWLGLGLGLVVASVVFSSSPLLVDIRFWRGYPVIPAGILTLALVSVYAIVRLLTPAIDQWTQPLSADTGLPMLVRLILRALLAIDPTILPIWGWIAVLAGSSASLLILFSYPHCITSNDVLISFRILKGGVEIGAPAPRETTVVERGQTIWLKASVQPVSESGSLPTLECRWADGGIGSDARLLRNSVGCTVDYQTGADDTADPVSLQVSQKHCDPLGDYPLFFAPQPTQESK